MERRSAKNADGRFMRMTTKCWDALAAGKKPSSLREYFGAPGYAELSVLGIGRDHGEKIPPPQKPARTAGSILPGIMGSSLAAG